MKAGVIASFVLVSLALPSGSAEAVSTPMQQLLSTKQCPNCNLAGAGLVHANLAGANLTGANLVGANLSRADLTGADLTGANLSGSSLHGANLNGANLNGANLSGTDLRGAYLGNANLTGTNLTQAQLVGVVGLPAGSASAEDFYRLGVEEARLGNYVNAIDRYNQAIRLKPDLAAAYFGRGMAKADLGDLSGAMGDARYAKELFVELKSSEGEQVASQLIQVIEARQNLPEREYEAKGGGILGVIQGITPLLLRLLPI